MFSWIFIISAAISPTYIIKLNFFHIPSNLLMLWIALVWVFFALWIIHKRLFFDFVLYLKQINKKLALSVFLFFCASVFSLLYPNFSIKKMAQFTVWFLQPLSLFLIGNYYFFKYPKSKSFLLNSFYALVAAMGFYAVLQYTSLWGLPEMYWGNNIEPKRSLSFFAHPNFYALFSAPLLSFLIPDLFFKIKNQSYKNKLWLICWGVGVLGLLFSMSRAGWLGLAAAGLLYLVTAADKILIKKIIVTFMVLVLVLLCIPNFRYRLILPFYKEKSSISRLSLWHTGIKGIKESPFFGLGLTGFAQKWPQLNTDPNLESHNFPHNIFLNFWLETGLMGLVSIISIFIYGIATGLKTRQDIYKFGVALFLVCLITQGLIDNPYFKNDLALMFWLIFSLL